MNRIKNIVIFLLLGIVFMSQTYINGMVLTTPAKPKITLFKRLFGPRTINDVQEYVSLKIKEGYQLKGIYGADNNFIVMEKY